MSAELTYAPAAGGLGIIDALLRDRDGTIARVRAGVDRLATMRVMVATIAIAMAIVGAAIGTTRGGAQIGYAAIKLPLVLLGTAAIAAPVMSAVAAALGRRVDVGADLALVVTALAYGALLLVACTPLVLLARAVDLSYHRTILGIVALFAVAGFASLRVIVRAIADGRPGTVGALAALCVVLALVGGQLAWVLRPYLVRPRGEIAFVREREGSLVEAVLQAFASARGLYARGEDVR